MLMVWCTRGWLRMFRSFLYLEMCVPRRPILKLCMLIIIYMSMLLVYYYEQETIRGRVSGRQVPGSLSDRPQVCYEVRVDAFLYLKICVSRRPIFTVCMCILCEGYTVTTRRRSEGAYQDGKTVGAVLTPTDLLQEKSGGVPPMDRQVLRSLAGPTHARV